MNLLVGINNLMKQSNQEHIQMNEELLEDINEENDEEIYMLLNVHEHFEDQLLKI